MPIASASQTIELDYLLRELFFWLPPYWFLAWACENSQHMSTVFQRSNVFHGNSSFPLVGSSWNTLGLFFILKRYSFPLSSFINENPFLLIIYSIRIALVSLLRLWWLSQWLALVRIRIICSGLVVLHLHLLPICASEFPSIPFHRNRLETLWRVCYRYQLFRYASFFLIALE